MGCSRRLIAGGTTGSRHRSRAGSSRRRLRRATRASRGPTTVARRGRSGRPSPRRVAVRPLHRLVDGAARLGLTVLDERVAEREKLALHVVRDVRDVPAARRRERCVRVIFARLGRRLLGAALRESYVDIVEQEGRVRATRCPCLEEDAHREAVSGQLGIEALSCAASISHWASRRGDRSRRRTSRPRSRSPGTRSAVAGPPAPGVGSGTVMIWSNDDGIS